MTITYANGTALEALLLSVEQHVLRVTIAGNEDVRKSYLGY